MFGYNHMASVLNHQDGFEIIGEIKFMHESL
jgi:hypothetical protein